MDKLYKINFLWPIANHYNIPVTTFCNNDNDMMVVSSKRNINLKSINVSMLIHIEENYLSKKNKTIHALDSNIIEYIFQFCIEANLNKYTSHSVIYLIERLLSKEFIKTNFELVLLTCIFLMGKIYDSKIFTLSELHQLSGNSYSNIDIINQERKILEFLDFKVINRDELLLDKVGILCENVKNIINKELIDDFNEICFESTDLIFENEYMRFIEMNYKLFLAAGILNSCFIILTKTTGITPLVIRLSILINCSSEDILLLTEKILKVLLRKETFKKFNF
jgi:hypothetical protein